jgi:hypothetical protein
MREALLMIDSNKEDVITLTEAAQLIPRRRGGKKCDPSCIYRWTSRGIKGIRLEFVQIGGTRCTSRQALARWFSKLTRQADTVPNSRSAKGSRHAAELAGEELKSCGL